MHVEGPEETKRIRDTLHNIIAFDHQDTSATIAWKVIQTPAFQRLRHIKQLGFSDYVYPTATHSRFEHSLGVFYIAHEFTKSRRFKEIVDFTPGEFLLAAVLHDIGHGPFSHAFERAFRGIGIQIDHELLTRQIILGAAPAEDVAHPQIKDVARSRGVNLKSVANSFGKPEQYGNDEPSDDEPAAWMKLIDSQLDVDRLDYIQRDQFMTGSKVGTIDYQWIFDQLTVNGTDIVVGRKGLRAIELYIANLFYLYETVYYHKTTRGVEAILCEIVREVFCQFYERHRYKKGSPLPSTGLFGELPLTKFIDKLARLKSAYDGPPSDVGKQGVLPFPDKGRKFVPDAKEYIVEFLNLTDHSVMSAIELIAARAKSERLRDLAKRLVERRLFKAVDVRDVARQRLARHCPSLFEGHGRERESEGQKAWIDIRFRIIERELRTASQAVHDTKIGALREEYEYVLEDYVTRDAYDAKKHPIKVKASNGGLDDLWDISASSRALGDLYVHRIYVDAEDRDEIDRRVGDWISDQKSENWNALNNAVNRDRDDLICRIDGFVGGRSGQERVGDTGIERTS